MLKLKNYLLCKNLVKCELTRNASTSYSFTKVITQKDVAVYAELTGDTNPVHFQGDKSIVHGTYLLGLVSSIMGTKCPGPGTKVLELSSKFLKPCPVGSEVEVLVLIADARKISQSNFLVTLNSNKNHVFVEGTAKLLTR